MSIVETIDPIAAADLIPGIKPVDSVRISRVDRRRVRTIRVALAGCGTVGGELVRILAHGADEIRARHGVRFELASVLVKHADRPRPGELPRNRLTTDVDAFLRAEADVVVEAIGGIDPAFRIAHEALRAGRRLVTANKALIAAHGPELAALARRSGGRLDFESAVAGGIPVVRALRDSLGLTGIGAVRGILNGTTNFILTRLGDGWRYADALAEAQARGFAEANPARDLTGEDAADKLRILGWLAFGVRPDALALRRRGIDRDPERLAADAKLLGGVPRLVAEVADMGGGRVAAAVEPVIVPAGSDLGRTRDEENAVVVESRFNGRVRLSGPGAGGAPTASALLGDMLRGAGRAGRAPARAYAPVEDAREHRWVLSVPREARAQGVLDRTLRRAGVVLTDVHAEPGRLVAVTRPVAWPRLDLATRVLEAERLSPVVSRCEVEV
ncbi:MAG TPA: homoserine dehydrogenase [Longimicrobium sp.]|nr:homoserine dehydrogenase [Longimicrobium sp.]